MSDIEWMDQAVCASIGSDPFYPPPDSNAAIAAVGMSICEGCPVRVECLEYALANYNAATDFGIWGGTTVMTRRTIRRNRSSMRSAAA